jgi:hypothetical protein
MVASPVDEPARPAEVRALASHMRRQALRCRVSAAQLVNEPERQRLIGRAAELEASAGNLEQYASTVEGLGRAPAGSGEAGKAD